jgi:hypothetical protein
VAVPSGWQNSRAGPSAVAFRAPAGRPSLRISTWAPADADPVAALVDQERGVTLPAYRRIRIEALPRPPDAIWEYTYIDSESGPVRGMERVMARDGRTYVFEWVTPREVWAANLPNLAVVLDSFRPPRGP